MRRVVSCLSGLAALTLFWVGGKCYAEENYYVGPDNGTWHSQANWSLGRLPISSDFVNIFNDLTVRITDDTHVDQMRVGYILDGDVIQESGTVRGSIHLGRNDGVNQNKGSYVLDGGRLELATVRLGYSNRDNTFTMNAGTISSSLRHIILGVGDAAGNNRFVMNGGTIDAFALSIYAFQTGVNTFIMNEGELNLVDDLSVSPSLVSFPTATTPGIFHHHGGTVVAKSLRMDDMPVYNLNGGALTLLDGIAFRSWSNGYFNFNGGVLNLPGDWDFNKLTSIAGSEFRVSGDLASEGDLQFGDLIFIDSQIYTPIFAIALPADSADFDEDGDVDGGDFLAWQQGFDPFCISCTLADGDANGDNTVDAVDKDVWSSQYGSPNTIFASGTIVPEPTTYFLALAALLLLGQRCISVR